jgi:hypothetical protein
MTDPRAASSRDFKDELHAYLNWLGPVLAEVGLGWDEVVVAERDESTAWANAVIGDSATDPARRGPDYVPEQFAERFAEILDEVERDWVNLSADTIQDGRLIVVVEWCSLPALPDRGQPARPVSVNWSGMGFAEIARLTGH